MPPPKFKLGSLIEKGLSKIGITEERVTAWLGRPCGCRERKEKLNRLGAWASSLLNGTASEEAAKQSFEELVPASVDSIPEAAGASPADPLAGVEITSAAPSDSLKS